MARKLVFALSLLVPVAAGCNKDEKNTSMNFDPKNAYKQSQDKYKQNVGAATTTAPATTTTTE
jgi:hypothetical protein